MVCRLHVGKTILGITFPLRVVVPHPVGVLRQYVFEPCHIGTSARSGPSDMAAVLFEICIVCVSVFVLLELTGLDRFF
jgi:hypothetical protein